MMRKFFIKREEMMRILLMRRLKAIPSVER